MRTRVAALALLSAVFAVGAPSGQDFTRRELDSVFYYDLGPESLDVSSYPAEQQANYRQFKSACSSCHTLARPINAPIVGRRAWEFYVFRMHLRAKKEFGTMLTKEQEKAVLDFLAYDSEQRKGARRAEFDRNAKVLQRRFTETIRERMGRLQRQRRPGEQ